MEKESQKWPFCSLGYDNSGLQPGRSITVGRSWVYQGEKANFKPFLNVPLKELEQRLKDSQAEEKKVFEAMKKAIEAWDEHGAQTLLLQKAIEYLKVPEVKHTDNEWKKQKDGSWEISNLTYKMTFSITRAGMDWKLAWELSYMAPGLQVGYRGYERTPRERIEYEGSKKYKTMDGAQKYVQAKFDQYAECFATLCPPVPEEVKSLFSVNGQLLPSYKLKKAKVVEPIEKTVSKLLDCLGAEDLLPPRESKAVEVKAMDQLAPGKGATPSSTLGAVPAKQEGIPKATAKKKPPHKKLAPVR